MSQVFLVSDTHFTHMGVCKFMRKDGVTKLRPWDTPEQMDEDMIEKWNAVVKPGDKVYHLGDVVMQKKHLDIMRKLNGRKVLIRGNHDIYEMKDYAKYFKDIRAYHVVDGLIFSHIPLHPESLGRFGCNVHGHTHANRVMLDENTIDPRYFCVCVEQTDYTPIAYEEVKTRILAQGGAVNFVEKEYGPT